MHEYKYPLLALSGQTYRAPECPLLGGKRTLQLAGRMSAFAPKRTSVARLRRFRGCILSEVGTMADRVASHYSENPELADAIAAKLRRAGKDFNKLTTADLVVVDEFHIRGRKATLELGQKMNLNARSHVLDIGSGLGGPARTLAETYGCRVTGIDLTRAFCDAATAMSDWV